MRVPTIATAVFLAALSCTACGPTTPATQTELCMSYSKLGGQLLSGNGIFGNPLFHAVKSTGSVAKRYQSDVGVQSDGARLTRIGDSSSLSGLDLENATMHIAAVCGHPLGIG